jgi:hypothetical protein
MKCTILYLSHKMPMHIGMADYRIGSAVLTLGDVALEDVTNLSSPLASSP